MNIGSFEIGDRGDYSINRAEAVTVLRELAQLNPEIAFAELVEINQLSNAHGRKSINEFLEKRNLMMKEEKEFVIVHQ